MSAITIISAVGIEATGAANKCQSFDLVLTTEYDTNVAPQESVLVIQVFNDGANSNFLYTSSDIVSTVGGVITYEKNVTIPRRTTPTTTIKVNTVSSSQIAQASFTPLISLWQLTGATVQTDINNAGTATANVFVSTVTQNLELEYSLNDVDYFESNVFTGLALGDYTLYARDAFGCQKSIEFSVVEGQQLNNFLFASLLNPVPFTRANTDLPNFDNTPSYSELTSYKYDDLNYKYPNEGSLKFQYRSNYNINEVDLLECGTRVQSITPTKITNNLNQEDIRDSRIIFRDGFLFAYYDGTGNIYDSGGTVIGANNLNGDLLQSQVSGAFIEVEGIGTVQILEVILDEDLGYIMKLNVTSPIVDDYRKVTTVFSLQNFEVYEFDVDLNIDPSFYQVLITSKESLNIGETNIKQLLSEVIAIENDFDYSKVFKHVWKNSENNQINWDTGIECYNYLPKLFNPVFEPQDDNEIYTTDTSKFQIESEVYETYKFHYDLLSLIQARQINMIASSDFLKINDIFYVKEETPEITANIGSNTYKAVLKLTVSSNYNSNENESFAFNLTDITGLIQND